VVYQVFQCKLLNNYLRDLIKSFIFKPKRLRSEQFLILKEKIKERSEKMIELGEKLRELNEEKKIKVFQKKIINDFRDVNLLN
jgi:hypothetical protein